MKRAIDGWREWFAALGEAAKMMLPRDPFVDDIERSAELARQRFEASMRATLKHEGGMTEPAPQHWRDEEWDRISAMAGLTPDGSIAPPPPGLRINRERSPHWKTGYPPVPPPGHATLPIAIASIKLRRSGYFAAGSGDAFMMTDATARDHVEGRNGSRC